jgi:hypothetical protein
MQSSRVRLMLVALFGVLALGALTAAAAQAVEAPRWSISGTDLAEGKTHYISTKAYKPFILRAGNIALECTVAKLTEGSLLGSNAGNPGKDNEVIEFSTCNVSGTTGGKKIEKCKGHEPVVTKPVVSELAETENAVPGTSGSLLTLFAPATGTEFAKLEFTAETGGVCPPETKVSGGEVIGEVRTDPNNAPELGKLVELPSVNSAEAESWLINFPRTPILKVTLFKGGVASQVTDKGLEAFSGEAELEGTALVLLAKKNTTSGLLETETGVKWSPLP